MCKGILPPFQEPLQLGITGWAGRYAEVICDRSRNVADSCVDAMEAMYACVQWVLTTMTLPRNKVYTRKSPGSLKRGDSRSMELPYW